MHAKNNFLISNVPWLLKRKIILHVLVNIMLVVAVVITLKSRVNIALRLYCESTLPYNGKEIKTPKLRHQNTFRISVE